jgi:hypothetical protein
MADIGNVEVPRPLDRVVPCSTLIEADRLIRLKSDFWIPPFVYSASAF